MSASPDRPAPPARRWLVVAFVAGFFATGAMLWTIPYADVSLPNSLMGAGLLLVVLAAMLARLRGRASSWMVTLVVGASVPAAIGARVMADTATDPTSHNLWPFEIVIGAAVGTGCAAAGALAAGTWSRMTRKG